MLNWLFIQLPNCLLSRTNVASIGNVFNDTQKVKVLSLPETIKEKSRFRAKALRRELIVGTTHYYAFHQYIYHERLVLNIFMKY